MVVHGPWPDPRVDREARALVRRGTEVDVVCMREGRQPPFAVEAGIRVHRLPVRRHRGSGAASQLAEYAVFFALATAKVTLLQLRRRFDVVQVHNLPDFLVFAAAVPKLMGAGIVLDLHDLMPEFYASRFGGRMDGLAVRLIRLQERLACGFADRVITVTELWRRALVERGVPADKLAVVMNVPDEAAYRQRRRRHARPTTERPLQLVYHGTIVHRYGLDLLVRALDLARREVPVRLLIHGWGDHLPTVRSLVGELELDGAVSWSLRRLAVEDLAALVGTADVGVVPYRRDVFTDGILPTKLLEYVAMGIPAIVARTPVVEAYFDETMVRFVPPEDVDELARAIVELARNPAGRAGRAKAARRFVERHNWRSEAAAYADLVRVTRGLSPVENAEAAAAGAGSPG
jgi:glycosyltransferase involved in cell wall biosynthesis